MKKTLVRILAFTLVAVMLVCMLASCGKKISGSYEAEVNFIVGKTNVTYTFSGSNVKIVAKTTNMLGSIDTVNYEGKYEIVENDDETMEITITLEEEDDNIKSGTYTFEEGEDYIKIGAVQYNKVEKK